MSDRIAVDFDGTLTKGEAKWWNDEQEQPVNEMLMKVNDLYTQGHTIIIWTARPWSEGGKIAGRLTEWSVRFHGIRCGKGSADLYIDDKAKRPEEVLADE